jgi:hypothetical protein
MMAGAGVSAENAETASPVVRRRCMGRSLRPRFLKRRNTGQPIAFRRVEGREIIARH